MSFIKSKQNFNVDSSLDPPLNWADGPNPNNVLLNNQYNVCQPRRSISTVTSPNKREVNEFYQHNFRNKITDQSNGESMPPPRPSIVSGQSNQPNHLQTKSEFPFDPIRFSPPNVTPPPSFIPQEVVIPRNRVRFDDLPSHPSSTYSRETIPPRKSSLAPNFFSSQNSHHMYPDQYTPRTWQNNDLMSLNNMHQSTQNQYISTNQQWIDQHNIHPVNNGNIPIRKHSDISINNGLNQIEIKLDLTDNQFTSNQKIMEESKNQHVVNPKMLSPLKMEIDHCLDQQQQFSLLSSTSSLFHLAQNHQNQINQNSKINFSTATVEHKRSHPNVTSRKASIMALKSQLRTPRGNPLANPTTGGIPYTPPPILAPMRNGSGLFCTIAKSVSSQMASNISDEPSCSNEINENKIVNGKKKSEESDGPSRKNGFFYMTQQMNQPNFADELEALRKESWASTSSQEDKCSIEKKNSIESENVRKQSCMSDNYYDMPNEGPHISDPNPHINIGREYQARVRKWNDREVHQSELEAIEDRDEIVFSSQVLNDIDPDQITAFELLACSQACPRVGNNKELALHLLMENKGNIEAAVEDLLRCDTLDWEQYSTIFGYLYNDCTMWTPDEVYQFQDAIYKSEKDFDKVAQELGGKSVRECVQFYYTWKKACPDDYRKLRNLRRKRQLLEMNLKMEDVPIPMKKCSLQESADSDADSNTTDASFLANTPSEFREQAFTSPIVTSPRASPQVGLSPSNKDLFGIQKNYQPTAPRQHQTSSTANKKGAQPSADGFFHCRLCDKCFEKVKSLNAHMKSHAMKARAEQEAKAHDAQLAAAAVQLTTAVNTTSPLNPFTNNHLGITIPSSIGNLTPQQLTPHQLNNHINQQLQSQLNSLSSQLNSQLNSPLTPQQQLQQFTQQQLMARAMQQNLFQPQPNLHNPLNGISQPHAQNPLLQAGLNSIH